MNTSEQRIDQYIDAMSKTTNVVNLLCAGNVQPQPINWLWPNRIALGKLTLIAGDPGLGKSLLSIELAKHVTKGIRWPIDDTVCPIGDVILLSAEDDPADTIRPRLDATGANPNKVYFLESIQELDKQSGEIINRGFSLKRDVAAIEQALEQKPQTKLIIIDPITAYLGGTDSHNNADIRSLLSPLSDLASERKVAIVAITHLNKGNGQSSAMYRATGSLAFIAAARAAFIVTKDKDDPDRRLFLPIKNNLGPDRTGFAYQVREASNGAAMIEWEPEPVSILADEALSPLPDDIRSERDEAAEYLLDTLNNGPVKAKVILRETSQHCGCSTKTIKRAKKELNIESYKRDFDGQWYWRLPEKDHDEEGQPCYSTVSPFEETQTEQNFQDTKRDKKDEEGQVNNAGTNDPLGDERMEMDI